MTVAEAEDEYLKAVRLGQKECAVLQGKGQNPFPVVLDQILGDGVSEGAQNVGTLEIPIERIVGVKSAGRISAFSAGFPRRTGRTWPARPRCWPRPIFIWTIRRTSPSRR